MKQRYQEEEDGSGGFVPDYRREGMNNKRGHDEKRQEEVWREQARREEWGREEHERVERERLENQEAEKHFRRHPHG